MYGGKLPMKNKTISIAFFVILFSPVTFGCSTNMLAEQYAMKIRELIMVGDEEGFRDLSCIPADCVDNDDIDYVFGTGVATSFMREFLKNPKIKIKIFGPFEYEEEFGKSSFSVIYYDPDIIRFDDEGHMSMEIRKTQWNKGYIETLVTCVDGVCGFHRTPFYYGAHLPWAEDY